MAIKTYGTLAHDRDKWVIGSLQPHVCIKLKAIFPKINPSKTVPFEFKDTQENCYDLIWFTERYPLEITDKDLQLLTKGHEGRLLTMQTLEAILNPNYKSAHVSLKDGFEARDYQLKGATFHAAQKRLLLGDDLGLGKTLTALLATLNPETRPAVVVVQTHLPKQWMDEGVKKFTNLSCHIIKQTKLYNLPPADVYIMKYSYLMKWVDFFTTGFFKSVIFDEVQELRREDSRRYESAQVLANSVDYCMGMSATPVYNYGDEIFNILNLINPGCLGNKWDFIREWATPYGLNKYVVKDPAALGTYLRESYLFLRRTRQDVGRELPPINKVVCTIGYDSEEVKKSEDLAVQLAIKVTTGTFIERGSAARELGMLVRHQTGVAKAKEVAAYVRILLENGEPVVLAGWHRDVYDIWMEELSEFTPVLYTGTESPKQKEEAKAAFISGYSKLFIISLRSGIGLDGLQHVCKTVVIGELDWSPQVHNQLIGRVDRDGQPDQVTAYFPVCDYGSDPVIIDLLGLKSSQSEGIVNPLEAPIPQEHDDTKMKMLAEAYLQKHFPVKDLFNGQ